MAADAGAARAEGNQTAELDRLNRELDDDPDRLEAFESINRICNEREDWKALEESYRRMLKRLPADSEQQLYEQHRQGRFVRAKARMTDEHWNQFVLQKEQDRTLDALQIPSAESAQVDRIEKHLKSRLHPGHMERMAVLARELVQSQAEVDLERWWNAVELTANRAGFIHFHVRRELGLSVA